MMMTTPDPLQGEMLRMVIVLGLIFGTLHGLLYIVQRLRRRWLRKRQIDADDIRRALDRSHARYNARRFTPTGRVLRADPATTYSKMADEDAPTLVLSALDAAMFVEHLARQRAEIETASVFEGKGGASGGAGASESWDDKSISPPGPVEAGTLIPARATEHEGNVGNHPDCCEP